MPFRSARFALFTLLAAAASAHAATRVLFIGNSFTYGHVNPIAAFNHEAVTDLNGTKMGGIPAIFKQLTVQAGLDYDVSIEAVGGQTLAYHVLKKADVLTAGTYDDIVLQAFSMEPLAKPHGGNPQNFYVGAAELKKLLAAKNPSAKLYAYATWSSPTGAQWSKYPDGRPGLTQMENDLEKATYKMAYDQKLTGVVRVGAAFEKALDEKVARPDPAGSETDGIDLWYKGDHRHPSVAGCYLSACMFYAKLTGKDPRTLQAGEGTAAAMLKITPDVAAALQKVAYEMNAAAEPTVNEVTTRHSARGVEFSDTNAPGSINTQDGEFKLLGTPYVNASRTIAQFGGNFTQDTRFVVGGFTSPAIKVSLVDSAGNEVGNYSLQLMPEDFGHRSDETFYSGPLTSATFSLSDLGVANLASIAKATGLRVDSKIMGAIPISAYTVPPPAADSIFVIGDKPPVVPPEKKKPAAKKPATQPKAAD